MARGISLRTLLLALTLCFGLLVLFLTLSGAPDGLRDSGVVLDWDQRSALMRSILSTQLARGVIALVIALLLTGGIATVVSRMFVPDTVGTPREAGEMRWVREASDAADRLDREAEEHAQREGRLERQRAEMDRLLEAVSEGILHVDAGARILRANRAARRLLGLPEDAAGKPASAVIRSAELRALLKEAASEPGLPPREILFEERTLIVTARPMREAAGAAGLAVAIADLTALRRIESVRRDFVANASHELKTPLTSIRGYAETLRDEELTADMRRQFLETISRNAERLQRIVDDLLDLSRLESGTWRPALVPVDAGAVAREAWTDFDERARACGVGFAIDDRLGVSVRADATALRHVFANLFDNALRYAADGGEIRVRISESHARGARARDRRTRVAAIEVSDDGSGIPSDALPRIFERFYRVDPARSRADGGTGLGLAIVRHMVESMEGQVEAESLLGQGTTIRVLLPVPGSATDAVST